MTKIHLKNVRLSFPSLYKKSNYQGIEGKYEATFLIPKKDVETKNHLDKLISEIIEQNKIKIKSDAICLKDGDEIFAEKEYIGYQDHWAIKASNNNRPIVVDRDKSLILEDDQKIYAGCYVNAIIEFWLQNNNYGKRINANLYGVQFFQNGEPFGSTGVDVIEDFDDLDEI